ncbi:hypothetical protein EB796_024610 [Bugula neritina]|uniref:Uncharacterized protein n=1 Tax=Bugula neritina TaxID=10212 RepID=A0A7J7IT36_BUGNE|nr:hypothetical protein EB796_024610 [Bugula neritina]
MQSYDGCLNTMALCYYTYDARPQRLVYFIRLIIITAGKCAGAVSLKLNFNPVLDHVNLLSTLKTEGITC